MSDNTILTVAATGQGGFEILVGNPTLTSLDGEYRAPLRTLLGVAYDDEARAAFGVYRVDTTPAEGQKWTGTFAADSEGKPVAVFEAISVSERRNQMLSLLEAKRWEVETGGIVLNGTPIKTDRETAAILTAARVLAVEDEDFAIPNWKAASGAFVSLDAPTIIAIADAVRAHVQACFDHESDLTAQILAAEDHANLDAIDIESGWPE